MRVPMNHPNEQVYKLMEMIEIPVNLFERKTESFNIKEEHQ
jgi:hypothetical protein